MQFKRDEPLSAHTTFCVGGPADYYLRPEADDFISQAAAVLKFAHAEKRELFILGGGANVLAADSGFRGIVLDTTGFSGCTLYENAAGVEIAVRAGTKSDELANFALENGLSGLEFLAGLPGTVGGAVWMNARCYERSISDVLGAVTIIDETLNKILVPFNPAEYDYKKSPFQNRRVLICEARFHVNAGSRVEIAQTMTNFRAAREAKGHFLWPSAGSVFKNNRAFGKPSGAIIEELGLRGVTRGGARVADWHGNFIINTGGAAATDIRALITLIQTEARTRLGIELEPEIIFLGTEKTSL